MPIIFILSLFFSIALFMTTRVNDNDDDDDDCSVLNMYERLVK
jgi:hypothetical protein